jgi:hypothetical protein
MLDALEDFTLGGPIGSELICHDHLGHVAQTFQHLTKEALVRFLITAALHQNVEHTPVLINRSPEVVQLASHADENLVQKPFVPGFRPAPLKGLGVGPSEAQAPLADGLLADHDASCRQDQFDLS